VLGCRGWSGILIRNTAMGGAFGSNEFQTLLGKLGINLDVMEIGFSLAPIVGSLASRCSRQSVSRRPVLSRLQKYFLPRELLGSARFI